MPQVPLRYQISNWRQLPACKSNTSRDLCIRVTDFIQDRRLSGLRIEVVHVEFGVLFAYVVHAKGTLIPKDVQYGLITELSVTQILSELAKYGFFITFHEYEQLPGDQIAYLSTLNQLKFDKLRMLSVHDGDDAITYVVAFNVSQNSRWLDIRYCPSKKEFLEALKNGSAINVSAICKGKGFVWDWLYDWVADIDDIIADNAGALRR